MKRMKKLALLIPVLPLLMATKALPDPVAEREIYSDISISGTYLGTTGRIDPIEYQYELDVENTGSENAILSFIYEYGKIYLDFSGYNNSHLFSEQMLAPGEHEKVIVKTDKSDSISDWSKYGIALFHYSIVDEDVSFENLSFKNTKYAYGFYYYVLEGKTNNLSDFYYDLVFDVTYKGEDYSFSYNLHYDKITTREELDLAQLEIKNVKAYRSSYKKVEEANWALLFVIAIIAMLFIIFILIPGLIILIVTLSVKHRNKKIIT